MRKNSTDRYFSQKKESYENPMIVFLLTVLFKSYIMISYHN
ncbi:Hypothetical protein TPAS_1149 [Trichococcus pasteurii]|uniref:Uncharacterized protein n=1 Tax=Trichococcus pasteurii TaxID=43064 RepID=A0A1W1IFB5_9LACT|nr:hypothetical protein SAMN04488086_101342 [Trichococcus pasteurii]SLM51473.1 Hypothetical protein TPAS_1149 [Trichococcus pasteurii]SSB92354.1 Hypothetical protein TPAS_1149 [Trichococcus pasteurii]